uniref:Ig-like domain-containing protein n=1 Tax=Neogobius melanostomus TaxID=47308 RepID=A0A8C6WHX7_9GOBI
AQMLIQRSQVLQKQLSLTLDPKWPEVFVGETLTLRCEVEGSGDGWTYDWSRNNELLTKTTRENTVSYVTESDRGDFSCRGVSFYLTTQWSSTTTVNVLTVTLDPNWSVMFVGERLTLRCEVENRRAAGWTYQWSRNNRILPETTREYTVSRLTDSDRGVYSCRGEKGPNHKTLWSSTTSVTCLYFVIPDKPVARVSADTELQTGGSVTLNCSVSPSSSGWKYEWIRNKQLFTHGSSELRVSEGGEYQCRAFRGDPPYFTELSPSFKITTAGHSTLPKSKTVTLDPNWSVMFVGERLTLRCEVENRRAAGWTYQWRRNNRILPGTTREYTVSRLTDSDRGVYSCRGEKGPNHKTLWSSTTSASVSLSVSPDRAQHFTGDVITLSCGFNSTDTDWRVQRLYQNKLSTQQCHEYLKTDETSCTFMIFAEGFNVFWCESGSGEMSNALNISVHSDRSKWTKAEFNISAVSRSDEGFYKCEAQELKKQQRSAPKTWTSLESWMSVRSETLYHLPNNLVVIIVIINYMLKTIITVAPPTRHTTH